MKTCPNQKNRRETISKYWHKAGAPKGKKTEEKKAREEELIRLVQIEGWPAQKAAKYLGIEGLTAYHAFWRRGIKLSGIPPFGGRENPNLSDENILKEHVSKAKDLQALAREIGTNFSTLLSWMAYHGIKRNDGLNGRREKFMKLVRKEDECWIWIDGPFFRIHKIGYSPRKASLILFRDYEAIKGGPRAKPTCGNRLCVNPDHLRQKNKKPEESTELQEEKVDEKQIEEQQLITVKEEILEQILADEDDLIF